jgi:nicotinamidase-related amidase
MKSTNAAHLCIDMQNIFAPGGIRINGCPLTGDTWPRAQRIACLLNLRRRTRPYVHLLGAMRIEAALTAAGRGGHGDDR